jgi:alanine racemase
MSIPRRNVATDTRAPRLERTAPQPWRGARRAAGSRVWSVVKADAYGHGLLARRGRWPKRTDGFALVELEGAMALRDAGIRQPILMLEGPTRPTICHCIAELELTPGAAHDVAGRRC